LADHKHEEEFKVIDRRLFTSDGQLRKEAVEEERRETETAKHIDAGKASGNSAPAQQKPAPPEPAAAKPVLSPNAPPPSHSFQLLVDFMARNAAVLMGGYADPRTGQPILDLEGAREFIDMLDMLYEKTKGNLAQEDERLLLDVSGSLKLSFLELSKAASAAATEKAKAHK
jgi:uncharacterized protein DUF1844